MARSLSALARLFAPTTSTRMTQLSQKTAVSGTEGRDPTGLRKLLHRQSRQAAPRVPPQGPQAGHDQGPSRFARVHGPHHALLDQTAKPLSGANIGASRTKPGTIDALIVRYLQHDVFSKGLAKATQATRRPILDNFR